MFQFVDLNKNIIYTIAKKIKINSLTNLPILSKQFRTILCSYDGYRFWKSLYHAHLSRTNLSDDSDIMIEYIRAMKKIEKLHRKMTKPNLFYKKMIKKSAKYGWEIQLLIAIVVTSQPADHRIDASKVKMVKTLELSDPLRGDINEYEIIKKYTSDSSTNIGDYNLAIIESANRRYTNIVKMLVCAGATNHNREVRNIINNESEMLH